MSTSTIAPALPELDPQIGAEVGDDILLGAARAEKTQKVPGDRGRSSLQSHTARAWTMGGQVD